MDRAVRGQRAGFEDHSTRASRNEYPTINNSRGWDANEEEGRAAVLGFVIDEERQRALIREISISQDDLNQKGELIRLVESADDKSLVSAAIGHLVAAIKTPGPLDRRHFNRFNVIDGTDAQNATGACCASTGCACSCVTLSLPCVRRRKSHHERAEHGNTQPDIKRTTKMLSLVSRLYSVFDNIRSSNPASDKVITSNVVHEADGVRRIVLCWMHRLPDDCVLCPLLIIDATADEKISRLPFAGRDAFYGDDVGKEIVFKRIKVDAPHMTLVKVIDAPYTKTALKPKAHEITVGEDGEHVARRALHGNSSLASVLRVADAICGRTVADGGSTGLITFKAVREDITERGADEDLILGHLGKTRGLNCMENTSSIFIAGRIALGIDKLEKLTCAIFGLDPEGEEPTLGLGMNYRAEAVLRARGADGRSLGNGLR